MKIKLFRDMLVDQLKDLHSAENQLVKVLPRMAAASACEKLRQGFLHHHKQTQNHVQRLEDVCERLGVAAGGKHCKAMEGLIAEGEEVIKEKAADPQARDAALICAAQKVEHYEIAGYGCVHAWALELGLEDEAAILELSLEEEKAADNKLTEFSRAINEKAAVTSDAGMEAAHEG